MGFSLIPQYSFRAITDISPDFLHSNGVKFLMLDLDNTVAAYSEDNPAEEVLKWVETVKNGGISLAIISNSTRAARVDTFAKALGIGYIIRASKPSPTGVQQLMETAGFTNEESALVGDQVFTDTLAANRAGVMSIIVKPRKFTNPFLALRYAAEIPFRIMVKSNEQY